jgi:hypothetical protein
MKKSSICNIFRYSIIWRNIFSPTTMCYATTYYLIRRSITTLQCQKVSTYVIMTWQHQIKQNDTRGLYQLFILCTRCFNCATNASNCTDGTSANTFWHALCRVDQTGPHPIAPLFIYIYIVQRKCVSHTYINIYNNRMITSRKSKIKLNGRLSLSFSIDWHSVYMTHTQICEREDAFLFDWTKIWTISTQT